MLVCKLGPSSRNRLAAGWCAVLTSNMHVNGECSVRAVRISRVSCLWVVYCGRMTQFMARAFICIRTRSASQKLRWRRVLARLHVIYVHSQFFPVSTTVSSLTSEEEQ